jgi:hypothetical protein
MTDPQQLLKNWVPWSAQGMEAFQSFMRAATGSGARGDDAPKPKART